MIRKLIQWLFFFAAIAAAVFAFFTIQEKMKMANEQPMPSSEAEIKPSEQREITKEDPNSIKTPALKRTRVNVININSHKYQASVTAYGAAQAHYQLTLTSQVSGLVKKLATNFESGQRISKNATLVKLEDNSYQAAIATAKANMSTAQLEYLQEVRQGEQAKAEWKTSGLRGQPKSPLVLRKPQLVAARATLDNTKMALANAKNNLRKTQIKSPFNAMIMKRNISPGSYLQAGAEVATLYSTDWLEIPLALSAKDWKNLPNEANLHSKNYSVKLKNVESDESWTGKVLRIEKQLDTSTRQRTLVVKVDNPFDQKPILLPGTFVEALLSGQEIDNLWELPASSLSQQSMIWYISQDNTLNNFSAKLLFSNNESIYIKAPDGLKSTTQQVLIHPLNAYVIGLKVIPIKSDIVEVKNSVH